MIVDDENIKNKISERNAMIRDGKDVTAINTEIKSMTERYMSNMNNQLNTMKNVFSEVKTETRDNKNISRKEYSVLIELYRKSVNLSKEISAYKKYLRGLKNG